MSQNQRSTTSDQEDGTVQRGTEVLSYGDRAVEKGDAVLRAYGPTTDQEADQSEIEVWCGTPRDVAPPLPGGVSRDSYRSALGDFAEGLITIAYCEQTDCRRFRDPNSQETDWFDEGPGRKRLFASFLSVHNQHLTSDDEKELRKSKRPDILTHKPERKEYYEIKPDSKKGHDDGRKKIQHLEGMLSRFQLPYEAGIVYTPPEEIEIETIDIEGIPIEIFLRTRRWEPKRPQVLLYTFCMRGHLKEANRRLGTRLRKMALLGLILGAIIIPIDKPIDKPGEEPIDEPGEEPIQRPIRPPVAAGGEDADRALVVPKPYQGPIAGTFQFNYVRGLPQNPVAGEAYPIIVSYESQGETYYTVIEFQVVSAVGNERRMVSINTTPLNIAPTGHEPLIIKIRNPLTITWHR